MSEIADIPTISLYNIFNNDTKENARLFDVCVSHGFFYLYYAGVVRWSTRAVDELFSLGKDFFALPEEEKRKISMESSGTYFGYKPYGANVVDDQGNRDQNEFLNMSKIDVLDTECNLYRSLGLLSDELVESCRTFILVSHDILVHILSSLSSSLNLIEDEQFESLHRLEGRSGDHLRLVKYAPHSKDPIVRDSQSDYSVMLIPHTDFGTLTLLLSERPGLQLMDPITKSWKFVEPRAGSAIVNVGDALAKFTNGLFRSCQHRVVKMSNSELRHLGNGAATAFSAPKYSLGYFLRPEDDVMLRRLHSTLIPGLEDAAAEEQISSKDWTERRVNASKVSSFGRKTHWNDLKGTALVWT